MELKILGAWGASDQDWNVLMRVVSANRGTCQSIMVTFAWIAMDVVGWEWNESVVLNVVSMKPTSHQLRSKHERCVMSHLFNTTLMCVMVHDGVVTLVCHCVHTTFPPAVPMPHMDVVLYNI